VPQLESLLTSQLELHDAALTGLQQATAELPQLESRLTSRLEQHDAALTGLQQATAELPQLESRLTSRLEQHDAALAGLQRAATAVPELESRLTSRLEEHDAALAELPQLTAVLQQLPELPRLQSRLEQTDHALDGLREAAAGHSTALHDASLQMDALQDHLTGLERQLAASRERVESAADTAREAASLQVALTGELHAVEQTVKEHAVAIESIRGAMARTDDFMERVVEALESLQTMVLEQAQSHSAAAA
jgi:chromosome segregation ATPase